MERSPESHSVMEERMQCSPRQLGAEEGALPTSILPLLSLTGCLIHTPYRGWQTGTFNVYLQSPHWELSCSPVAAALYKVTLSEWGYSTNQLILPSLMRVGPTPLGPPLSLLTFERLQTNPKSLCFLLLGAGERGELQKEKHDLFTNPFLYFSASSRSKGECLLCTVFCVCHLSIWSL